MKFTATVTFALALLMLASIPLNIAGADRKKGGADKRKRLIEAPLQLTVAKEFVQARAISPKYRIEKPTKTVVADSIGDFTNPKVAAGKVKWHEDHATACAAAKKSGRPVLLFQLMGKLDEVFC